MGAIRQEPCKSGCAGVLDEPADAGPVLMGRGGSRRQLLLALVAACLAGSGLGATVQRELEDLGAPKRYGRGGWQPLWDPSQVPSHPPEWKEFHQSPLNPDGGEVRASICISVHLCKAAAACSLHA